MSPDPLARLMDIEANAFAMELLMPAALLNPAADGLNLDDPRAIERLARRFRVDPHVLAIRLGMEMFA